MTSRSVTLIATAVFGAIVGLGIAVLTQDFNPPLRESDNSARRESVSETGQTSLQPPAPTFDPRFQSCAHCHQVGPTARNSSGPVLNNLLGRKAASTDYPYSKAMRESGIVWDEGTLRAFLKAPQSVVPRTRMAFGGMEDKDIDALMDFLKSTP